MAEPTTPTAAIENVADDRVDDSLDAQLRDLLSTCFPKDAVFRERRYWREPPLHRWFIRDNADRLAAHACVHRRVIGTGAGELAIGGIAEVCVRPEFRGNGYVRQMLAEIHEWLAARDCAFAVLFGRTEVYASSGYANIDNVLRHTRPETGQEVEEKVPSAMIRPLSPAALWPPGLIDLRGAIF